MTITNGTDLIAPHSYAQNGPPHDVWTRLRRESPVHYCTPEDYPPFWAVTRHADICAISKRPDLFLSAPGIIAITAEQARTRESNEGLGMMRTIIEMDPPEHRSYRKLASPWFTPRAVQRMNDAVEVSAREQIEYMARDAAEGLCDFAAEVATAHPLRILSMILGVPREVEPTILRLTTELFAADDPELQREGEDRQAAIRELGLELFQVFDSIIQDRRKNPRDDLASLLANGLVDGEPMGPMETFGYYLITFTAGHDTTKNALAGGMRAFAENPDQLAKLSANPAGATEAVEEIVRWTTPVNYMKRTAACDTQIGAQKIREGEEVALFYASANRDEAVFDDPFAFRVDRSPNPHLGFGIGEHFCLGANLARVSQRAWWREFASRIECVELEGDPEQIASSFIVGLKHLPIRYHFRKS